LGSLEGAKPTNFPKQGANRGGPNREYKGRGEILGYGWSQTPSRDVTVDPDRDAVNIFFLACKFALYIQ
jgi:hypothetical protein